MKRLKVDMDGLTYAFEDASWTTAYYLDLETGQVLMIMEEIRFELEETYEPEAGQDFDLAAVLREQDSPEWRQDALLEAGEGDRYLALPGPEPYQGYDDMQAFIGIVRDESLQERLERAIHCRGAFRRFKDVLAGHLRERERWFEFKEERLRERALDWLASEGIQPILPSGPEEEALQAFPPAPPPRAQLIAEALAFVQAASQLPGVMRIALIGSLTTDQPEPKDVDLLVAVADDMDLASLATLGRKIQGHAQSFNRGADIFLADPHGNYLGRTCPWKHCGLGIWARCDALHCGRRPYLHDDLEDIRLDGHLIAAPPIELWPQVVARVPVPADVEAALLTPLRGA